MKFSSVFEGFHEKTIWLIYVEKLVFYLWESAFIMKFEFLSKEPYVLLSETGVS